jgi:hypothetical protein
MPARMCDEPALGAEATDGLDDPAPNNASSPILPTYPLGLDEPAPSDASSPVERPSPRLDRADQVVITGISCRLPESDNMEEFRQHLILGEDMVTGDNRRWEPGKGAWSILRNDNDHVSFV